jgi:hypothetical protein
MIYVLGPKAPIELRGLYEADERLRVPAMVYNAVLQRTEPI